MKLYLTADATRVALHIESDDGVAPDVFIGGAGAPVGALGASPGPATGVTARHLFTLAGVALAFGLVGFEVAPRATVYLPSRSVSHTPADSQPGPWELIPEANGPAPQPVPSRIMRELDKPPVVIPSPAVPAATPGAAAPGKAATAGGNPFGLE